MRFGASWAFTLAIGCSGSDGTTDVDATPTDTEEDPPGACGDVGTFDALVRGHVEDANGAPIPFAQVWLEERNWAPGEKGRTVGEADGTFVLDGRDLPVVEDCWGVATQFWLVGEKDGLTGEWPATRILIPAYESGVDADMGPLPLVLE